MTRYFYFLSIILFSPYFLQEMHTMYTFIKGENKQTELNFLQISTHPKVEIRDTLISVRFPHILENI